MTQETKFQSHLEILLQTPYFASVSSENVKSLALDIHHLMVFLFASGEL